MTIHDLFLLSPELSIAAAAVLVVLADLVLPRKGVLPIFAVIGLAVAVGFSVGLWFQLDSESAGSMHGIFGTLVVDKFSLFFKFLLVAVAAPEVL